MKQKLERAPLFIIAIQKKEGGFVAERKDEKEREREKVREGGRKRRLRGGEREGRWERQIGKDEEKWRMKERE